MIQRILFLLILLAFCFWISKNYINTPEDTNLSEEEKLLLASNGLAKRDGNVLLLELLDHRILKLNGCAERNQFDGDCHDYDYKGMIARKQFFIVYEWYAMDGLSIVAISRKSGSRVNIEGDPYLSPDGNHILSPLASESDGENGLHLWKIADGELIPIHLPGDTEMYQFKNWIDAKSAELFRYTYSDPRVSCRWVETHMLLSQAGSEWKLHESAEPICPSHRLP